MRGDVVEVRGVETCRQCISGVDDEIFERESSNNHRRRKKQHIERTNRIRVCKIRNETDTLFLIREFCAEEQDVAPRRVKLTLYTVLYLLCTSHGE